MTRHCARPGCNAEATATLTYDYGNRNAWVERLSDEPHPMTHDLCERHADGLSRAPRAGASRTAGSSSRSSASAATSPPDVDCEIDCALTVSRRSLAVASGQADEHATASADVRWGLGDAAVGFVLAWVLTAVLTPLIFVITGVDADTPTSDIPLRTIALQQVPFDGAMLGGRAARLVPEGTRAGASTSAGGSSCGTSYGLVVGVLTQYAALLLYVPLLWFTSSRPTTSRSRPATSPTRRAAAAWSCSS